MAAALVVVCMFAAAPVSAQTDDYPAKRITLVLANGPGTTSDIYGRLFANELSKLMNVAVVVDNRAGADGQIASRHVAAAAPDGYTLYLGTSSTHAVNPVLLNNIGYDPVKDFSAITLMSRNNFMLAVPSSSPIKTLKEFLDQAKAGRNFRIAGATSTGMIASKAFEKMSGSAMTYVTYKTTAAALTELIAGHIDAMFVDIPNGVNAVADGTIRPLAVTSGARLPAFPDLVTFTESGFPGFEIISWAVICGPANMPKPIVDKLNAAFAKIFAKPEVTKVFAANGSQLMISTAGEADRFVATEAKRWAELMRVSGVPKQ